MTACSRMNTVHEEMSWPLQQETSRHRGWKPSVCDAVLTRGSVQPLDSFNKAWGRFPAVFVATDPDVFDKTFSRFLTRLWDRDLIIQASCRDIFQLWDKMLYSCDGTTKPDVSMMRRQDVFQLCIWGQILSSFSLISHSKFQHICGFFAGVKLASIYSGNLGCGSKSPNSSLRCVIVSGRLVLKKPGTLQHAHVCAVLTVL